MKALRVTDAETMVMGIQDEIRRSEESRYDHRLHGVLLVAQGMTCPEVADLLGDSKRAVEYWVKRFEREGFAGLAEGQRSGRPRRLTEKQVKKINTVLRRSPSSFGLGQNLWDGKTLSTFIEQEFGVELGVRQCQRLFRQLGFRLRKPRGRIAHADPEVRKAYKKTAASHRKSGRRSLGRG